LRLRRKEYGNLILFRASCASSHDTFSFGENTYNSSNSLIRSVV